MRVSLRLKLQVFFCKNLIFKLSETMQSFEFQSFTKFLMSP